MQCNVASISYVFDKQKRQQGILEEIIYLPSVAVTTGIEAFEDVIHVVPHHVIAEHVKPIRRRRSTQTMAVRDHQNARIYESITNVSPVAGGKR